MKITLEPGMPPRMVDWLIRRLLGDWPDPDQRNRIERTRRVVETARDMIPEIQRTAAMRASYQQAGRRLRRRAEDRS